MHARPARPRCTAAAKSTGQRCRLPAIPGGTVCARFHGGAAPQVQRAARIRLWELVDPAIAVLANVIADPDADTTARLRAAENVLDRAGWPRRARVEPVDADALAARIADLADTIAAEQGPVDA